MSKAYLSKKEQAYWAREDKKFLNGLLDKYFNFDIKEDIVTFIEKNRKIPIELSAIPGSYRFKHTPYLREIIENFNENSLIQEVAVMKGAQIGATVGLCENLMLYIIAVLGGSTLFLASTQDIAEDIFEARVDPAIDSSGLRHLIKQQTQKVNSRLTGDTKSVKYFNGGFIRIAGLASISKLKSFSIKTLIITEADEAKADLAGQGHPVALAERRQATFSSIKKTLIESTPKNTGYSVIEDKFLLGDQRYYHVPCKHCGQLQKLEFENLKYETDDDEKLILDSVYYECKFCSGGWKNVDKLNFLLTEADGGSAKWIPANPLPAGSKRRSYHISSLYSPVGFESWETIITNYLEALVDERNGNKEKMKLFYNQTLGLTFQESEAAPPYAEIAVNNKGSYVGENLTESGHLQASSIDFNLLKYKPCFCTMAADIQKSYIEIGIVLWAREMRSYTIGYHRIHGNTSDITNPVWQRLEKIITSKHAGMYASVVFIDSGFNASLIYNFCENIAHKTLRGSIVFPIKGSNNGRLYKVSTEKLLNPPLINLNSNLAKLEVYSRLEIKKDDDIPPKYPMFPSGIDLNFFKMLTAEERIIKHGTNGKESWEWVLPKGKRNEALDIMGYNIAAAHFVCDQIQHCKDSKGATNWNALWDMFESESWGEFRSQPMFTQT